MTKDSNSKPAVFIDRDGTLIEEVNFLSKVEDLRIFPYTPAALATLRDNDYRVVVITNQSGIGRKIFSESEMQAIHDAIERRMPDAVDAFYYCPHLPGDGCRCRKPTSGL